MKGECEATRAPRRWIISHLQSLSSSFIEFCYTAFVCFIEGKARKAVLSLPVGVGILRALTLRFSLFTQLTPQHSHSGAAR